VSFARNVTGGAALYATPTYGGFIQWWKLIFELGAPGQASGNVELASCLLTGQLAKERPEEVARIALLLDGVSIPFATSSNIYSTDFFF